MRTVLVTSGAGYVGSHCCKAFAEAGWRVAAFDNLSRGWRSAVRWGPLVEGDVSDPSAALRGAFEAFQPDLVAHFAAYAYVAESTQDPAEYYRNNSLGTMVLLDEMRRAGLDRIIFSSTCATYGEPVYLPIDETHPQKPINPYGWSKLFVGRMLADYGHAYGLNSVSLRYFNAAGCDVEGEIGEDHDPETHAIPLAIDAALHDDRLFTIHGDDFDTPDGAAVRDYVHVDDLARAHVLAGDMLLREGGVHVYNLGAEHGVSVLDIVSAIEQAHGKPPRYVVGPRRLGDPAALIASSAKARAELGRIPQCSGIDTIVGTALSWRVRKAAG
jgi:UDP-arabinose 4-epimerase